MDIESANPKIDPRNLDDLFNYLKKELFKLLKDSYRIEWRPAEGDVGLALLKIYSHMLDEIIQRLNRVPEKNFIAFLDMLGIQLLPAQPAVAPITFVLAEGAKEHVFIPAKTQVAAGETIFETEKSILATPAKLVELYSFNPKNDELYSHMPALNNRTPFSLLTGENLQEHILYLGHKDLFNIKGKTIITIGINESQYASYLTNTNIIQWEYWGERTTVNGEETKTLNWYPFDEIEINNSDLILEKNNNDEIKEREIAGIKSRWIRCKTVDINKTKEIVLNKIQVNIGGAFKKVLPFKNFPPIAIRGVGKTFSKRLSRKGINTVEELLKYTDKIDDLAKVISREGEKTSKYYKEKAENILENTQKRILDDEYETDASDQSQGIPPDMAFYNDVPLDLTFTDPIYPFGKIPRLYDTFYIASQEVFSKKGAKITFQIKITIDADGNPTPDPQLSWEYWNGKGWMKIDNVNDPTESFTISSDQTTQAITFICPGDIQPIKINGQENSWIRIRLVDGHFGKEFIIKKETGTDQVQSLPGKITPPTITTLFISYNYDGNQENLEHVLIKNNLEFKDVTRECKTSDNPFTPFQEFAEDHGALYLGLDKKMERGPISFFFSIDEEKSYNHNMPEIDWFYFSENKKEWELLDKVDNTNNLTASGTVEFLIPRDFAKTSYFGNELYWIKPVFVKYARQMYPRIKGIYINTVLALQAEGIEEEILGSSDGSANQAFKFVNTPVIEQEIRVNETTTLTEEEKNQIINEKGEDYISETKDETGITTGLWVRWQPVKDFLDSSPNDRHYVMDGAMGEITFGSGINGKIPPIGIDNIKANYRTGGGQQGNLETNEISDLKTSLPFVDTVTNHQHGEGGSDTEQLAEVLVRGPHLIKHRNRAVTEEDFQRLAREASNYIARTKCLIKDNKLIIIIIPKGQEDKPTPSPTLIRKVEKYLVQRSLNIIHPSSLEVHPPAYIEIKVTADVVPVSIDLAVPLEEKIMKRLKEFFHPLTGGPEGTGWQFGRDAHISDVYAMLEEIDGVDHVEKLKLEKETKQEAGANNVETDVTLENWETVCSGTHDITMTLGG